MDLYDCFNTFITAVAQDSSLAAWAQTKFASGVTVFVDYHIDGEPTEDDRPYVIFPLMGFEKDQESRTNRYALMDMTLVLSKEDLKVRTDSAEEPKGIELMSDFATHIMRIFAAALPARITAAFAGESVTIATDDELVLQMDAYLTEKVLIGQNPLN